MLTLYDQTAWADQSRGKYGDHYRACVATLLQSAPYDMPFPMNVNGNPSANFSTYLACELNIVMRKRPVNPDEPLDHELRDIQHPHIRVPRLVIALGKSPRGKRQHSIVYDRMRRRMVHDPHPSGDGVVQMEWIEYPVSLDVLSQPETVSPMRESDDPFPSYQQIPF